MMRLAPIIYAAPLMLSIQGCQQQAPAEAIDYRSISAVEAEVKHEIGVYLAASAYLQPAIVDAAGKLFPLPSDTDSFACGAGLIRFDISSVKADLLVTEENIAGASGGLAAPVEPATLTLSGGYKRDTTNSQELIYNVWFAPLVLQDPKIASFVERPTYASLESAPIAKALISLRDTLIASSLKVDPFTHQPRQPQPCHTDWNRDPVKPGGDPGNSLKFGITVARDTTGGFGLKIYLVDLDLSEDYKGAHSNTITVNFYQAGTLDVLPDDPPVAITGKPSAALTGQRNQPLSFSQSVPSDARLRNISAHGGVLLADEFNNAAVRLVASKKASKSPPKVAPTALNTRASISPPVPCKPYDLRLSCVVGPDRSLGVGEELHFPSETGRPRR